MVNKNKKRNVIVGFKIEDYEKLKRVCEMTFRSKAHFIRRLVIPEIEHVLKEAKKNAAVAN